MNEADYGVVSDVAFNEESTPTTFSEGHVRYLTVFQF